MPKRYDAGIYAKICTMENLRLAHENAKKDKLFYKEVKRIEEKPDFYLRKIQNMLLTKTYSVGKEDYTIFTKKDKGKTREIYKLPYYPHRIIQHAIILQTKDIFLKNFISDTYASIPGRGVHRALIKMDNILRQTPEESVYCLQMDIKKFYPNISQEVLMKQLEKKFKCKDLLWLFREIVFSLEKGLPIGSLFSQWAGNFNLSPVDHWLKETLKVKHYIRYMDDMIIFHSNKKFLHEVRIQTQKFLEETLELTLKSNYKVFPVDKEGVKFLGYHHYRDVILLGKHNYINLVKKSKQFKTRMVLTEQELSSLTSYEGMTQWCNGRGLREKWIEPHKNKAVIRSVKKSNSQRNTG